MSESLHLDPDSLSAFLEGVLPEHERTQCLAHLAECANCREIVFLAQEAVPAPVTLIAVPSRGRWFARVQVLAAAAALLIAVLGLSLYLRSLYLNRKSAEPETVARVDTPVSTPAATPATAPAAPPLRAAPAARNKSKNAPIAEKSVVAQAAPPTPLVVNSAAGLAAPQPVGTVAPVTSVVIGSVAPSIIPSPTPPAKDNGAEPAIMARISGTVVDPSGAVVPGASVTLNKLADSFRAETRADAKGQFMFAGLAAGQYELQIASAGFRVTTMKVLVEPQQVALVRPELAVGSAAETVEVAAAASTIQTERSSLAGSAKRKQAEPRPLPSKLAASVTVTSGKTMVVMDSTGALFVSRNSGKSWQTVKPVWKSKAGTLRLVDPPQPKIAVFELMTESGAVWFSRDGSRWYAAAAER